MAGEAVNVKEFQELARKALPKLYYDFFAGGAEDEHTLGENVKAFSRITIRPRILIDVSQIDMSISILGHRVSSPIIIAPTGFHKLANPEGELAMAKAAAACKTLMVLSFSSTTSMEEVASIGPGLRFFQLYDKGSGFRTYPNITFDSSLCWKDINWLKSITKLPILIKGILTHEDAIKAVEVGVDGIIVSNHGARQLDYSPPTISVLEEIVGAVGDKVPVLMDGGVRRGTDVFKALALGARAVLVGRPVIFGLAAKGENGVKCVIEMLKDELELTMALAGCTTIKDITRSHVRTDKEAPQSML